MTVEKGGVPEAEVVQNRQFISTVGSLPAVAELSPQLSYSCMG